ncbi:MAG: 30S ribosomal protein S16 [Candidatus Nomurabacteria bacterium]|jgi:small subunit ribosomal protein S16|nr:30S ribosomal protein S16 [Candidatus Nomurabacteria bacterium]
MLAIRLQRGGRKAYPTYRVVVQDAQRTPTSGSVVAYIGNYNPHTKDCQIDKTKAEFYLKNGAQPTTRVAKLLKDNKISLPKWVKQPAGKTRAVKNPDKLRKNQPKEEPKAEAEQPNEADKPAESAPEAAAEAESEPAEAEPAE